VDQEFADVPWSRVAAVLAINRLCDPGSELAIERHWDPGTALDDLLHIEAGKINDTRLYRCLDRLVPLKTQIEQHLKQRFGKYSPTQALKRLSELYSVDIVLRTVWKGERSGCRELPSGRTNRKGYSTNSTWSCRNVCSPCRS
jgi:hypothetical protein